MPRQVRLNEGIHAMPGREDRNGRPYYRLRYRDRDGKARWHGLGRGTNQELNDRADDFRKSIEGGKDTRPRKMSMTVAQAWESYETRRVKDLRKSTGQGYASIWRRHLEPRLGDLPLRAVSEERLREVLDDATKDLSAKTRNHVLELMKAFFAWCVNKGLAGHNPASGISKKDVPLPVKLSATGPDISALKRDLEADWDRQDFLLVWLLEVTGVRFGEALGLRWGDLMERGWRPRVARIRRDYVRGEDGATKTHASKRTVPLTSRLADALALMMNQREAQPEDYVFLGKDGKRPLCGDDWRKKVFKPASVKAGVRFHIKDLRDYAITRWVESGDMNLLEVQEVAGHTQAQTTMGYFRRSGTSQAKARKAMERAAL